MQLSTLSLVALFVFYQSTAYSLRRRTSSLDKKCWKALQFRPFPCKDRLNSANISNCLINEGAKDELSRAAIILNPITFALSPSEKLPTFKEIFLSQTTLFTATLLVQLFTGTQLTPPVGFLMMSDQDSFLKVLGASLPLLAGGNFLESVPLNITKNIKSGTELFSIRHLGRSTPRVIAAFKALVISAGAGGKILSIIHVMLLNNSYRFERGDLLPRASSSFS